MTVTREAHVAEWVHEAQTSVGEVSRQRDTRIDDQLEVSEEPMDHAVTRGRDESLRFEGGHSPEYHTVVLDLGRATGTAKLLRPDFTVRRTLCCELLSRGP